VRQKSAESVEMAVFQPQASGTEAQSPQDVPIASPVESDPGQPKEKVEDIVEEEEPIDVEIYDQMQRSNEPLNLCMGDEADPVARTSRQLSLTAPSSSTYSSQSSLSSGSALDRSREASGLNLLTPPEGSVLLRNQLLGLSAAQAIGPTPPQYQTRDRSATMPTGNRVSVIRETRAALNPRPTLSAPPTNRRMSGIDLLQGVHGDTFPHSCPPRSGRRIDSNGTGTNGTGDTFPYSCPPGAARSRNPSGPRSGNAVRGDVFPYSCPPSAMRAINPSGAVAAGDSSGRSGSSNGTKRVLECVDCHKTFSQLRNFRYHRSRHEGSTQFACVCPVCNKTVRTILNLKTNL